MVQQGVGRIISLVAQRVVTAPPEVQETRGVGKAVVIRRYKEGLILEPGAREELITLGYSLSEIEQTLVQARLEREYDIWADKVAALKSAYLKGYVLEGELLTELDELIPDTSHARAIAESWLFQKAKKVS